jgi:hypothetical protein
VPVVRIEITAPDSIEPGQSVQLAARAVRSNGSTEDVTGQAQWSSSNSSVLQVSQAGLATAVTTGEATVTARYQSHNHSRPILSVPAGTFKLVGQVTEGGFPVEGVAIEVIAGVGEGLTSRTDGEGFFALYGVGGRVTIHAKKEGYANRTEQIDVAANASHGNTIHSFEMVSDGPRRNLSGTYRLTLEAVESPHCSPSGTSSLPDAARTRSYDATVAQHGAGLTVTLGGADFIVTNGRGNHFDGIVDPNDSVTFSIGDDNYYYYYYSGLEDLVERFNDTSALVINGVISAKANAGGMAGTLNGRFRLAQGHSAPFSRSLAVCYSDSHLFDMRRQ